MPIIEWKGTYMIGIDEIDRHQKNLVNSLNMTYDQFKEGKKIDMSFLQELIDYSTQHFACEESWMRETCYPDLAAHQHEHAIFTSKISKFKKSCKSDASTAVELLWFLCNWVTHHIRETDADFGRFVNENRVRTGTNEEFTGFSSSV